jgi:CSLREA domain-containing protein
MQVAGRRWVVALATGVLTLALVASPVAAAGTLIIVDSIADTAADDGVCTLREAITAANDNAASGAAEGECPAGSAVEGDEIGFSTSGTILLGSDLPAITGDLRIAALDVISVDGQGAARPFVIADGTVSLEDFVITGGKATSGAGGAIFNSGNLTLYGITITDSSADDTGGGIHNIGTLVVGGSLISGNDGGGFGGGINNLGALTILNSTIADNKAVRGAGLYTAHLVEGPPGTAFIVGSTFSGNEGAYGAGILNAGETTIANSTISGNTAESDGGGVGNVVREDEDIHLALINVTITGNTSGGEGGGLGAGSGSSVTNTIIAGNTAQSGDDVSGSIAVLATSIVGVPGGKVLADILDPAGLQDNGPPTQTVALVPGSGNPAIDSGDNAVCAAKPVGGRDQRGVVRPADACDIGAYEVAGPEETDFVNPTQAETSTVQSPDAGSTLDQGLLVLFGLTLFLVAVVGPILARPSRR